MSSWIISTSKNVLTLYCKKFECCNDEQIPYKIDNFKDLLSKRVCGQHIAVDIIVNAIISHVKNSNPKKPLVMGFHGPNGSGKTYISRLIAETLYENGENSRYFHFYYGLQHFPLIEKLSEYQDKLRTDIDTAIKKCGKSLFIFDGVDQMPPGLLNILMPFLDCPHCDKEKTEKNKAIFIFLTNAGSLIIQNSLLDKLSQGIDRKSTTFHDFEKLIISEIFTHDGGLFKSLMIKSDAIDFYVPFLPLEKEHVAYCIKEAFNELNISPIKKIPYKSLENKVFKELRFGPEPDNLFSSSGCKRVSQITGRLITSYNTNINISSEIDFHKSEL
ncbi:PREDICTED: torsin-1A-like [Ceratosolen solmsi marchali]|uniref:Torsin-1A-like n=1 Tax=Ceratosolen solmsi marchali TaxID=326594 RepID=A0AAJ6YDN3_9HYME|nr:PREDICTED: torsin-1A-like [Ceratosolen solmsi marchali]